MSTFFVRCLVIFCLFFQLQACHKPLINYKTDTHDLRIKKQFLHSCEKECENHQDQINQLKISGINKRIEIVDNNTLKEKVVVSFFSDVDGVFLGEKKDSRIESILKACAYTFPKGKNILLDYYHKTEQLEKAKCAAITFDHFYTLIYFKEDPKAQAFYAWKILEMEKYSHQRAFLFLKYYFTKKLHQRIENNKNASSILQKLYIVFKRCRDISTEEILKFFTSFFKPDCFFHTKNSLCSLGYYVDEGDVKFSQNISPEQRRALTKKSYEQEKKYLNKLNNSSIRILKTLVPETAYEFGKEFLQYGRKESAAQMFESAGNYGILPGYKKALQLYYELEQKEKVEEILTHLKSKNNAFCYDCIADFYAKQKKDDEVESIYELMLKNFSDIDFFYVKKIGDFFIEKKNYQRAKKIYFNRLKNTSLPKFERLKLYAQLAELYIREKDFDSAEEYIYKSIGSDRIQMVLNVKKTPELIIPLIKLYRNTEFAKEKPLKEWQKKIAQIYCTRTIYEDAANNALELVVKNKFPLKKNFK